MSGLQIAIAKQILDTIIKPKIKLYSSDGGDLNTVAALKTVGRDIIKLLYKERHLKYSEPEPDWVTKYNKLFAP